MKTRTGAQIVMSDTGIEISNGMGAVMKMTGPQIDFNSGALTIT